MLFSLLEYITLLFPILMSDSSGISINLKPLSRLIIFIYIIFPLVIVVVGEVSVDHHDIVLFNYAIGGSMMNNISLCCFKDLRYRPCEKDVLEYLN